MSELLLCPFCGSERVAAYVYNPAKHIEPDAFVQCADCGICGPKGETIDRDGAEAAWNRRAQGKAQGLNDQLNIAEFDELMQAAKQSNWIPDHYTIGDWVIDCREFLLTGRLPTELTATAPQVDPAVEEAIARLRKDAAFYTKAEYRADLDTLIAATAKGRI